MTTFSVLSDPKVMLVTFLIMLNIGFGFSITDRRLGALDAAVIALETRLEALENQAWPVDNTQIKSRTIPMSQADFDNDFSAYLADACLVNGAPYVLAVSARGDDYDITYQRETGDIVTLSFARHFLESGFSLEHVDRIAIGICLTSQS